VRVLGHRRAPSVEHGGDADTDAEMLWIGGNGDQCLGRRAEQQIVDHRLVLVGNRGDLGPARTARRVRLTPPPPRLSVPWRCRGHKHRRRAIKVRKQALQGLDLRQIVDDDIGIVRVARQEVLMIVLGRVEIPAWLGFSDDRASNTCAWLSWTMYASAMRICSGFVGKIAERY